MGDAYQTKAGETGQGYDPHPPTATAYAVQDQNAYPLGNVPATQASYQPSQPAAVVYGGGAPPPYAPQGGNYPVEPERANYTQAAQPTYVPQGAYVQQPGAQNDLGQNSIPQVTVVAIAPRGTPGAPLPKPRSYICLAVVSAIFCCLPAGLVAIICACMVGTNYSEGNYEGALRASRSARTWSMVAIVCGVIVIALSLVAEVNTTQHFEEGDSNAGGRGAGRN